MDQESVRKREVPMKADQEQTQTNPLAAAAAVNENGHGHGHGHDSKKPRVDDLPSINASQNTATTSKTRLSKWAARLFDPDRPRGLIQPPKTIPLNDEFLKAFGKREKEYNAKMGRTIHIDQSNLDWDDDSDRDQTTAAAAAAATTSDHTTYEQSQSTTSSRKVKITNLPFTLTQDELRSASDYFGPVDNVNLIQDNSTENNTNRNNAGRAYVTFESPDGAQACIDGLKQLHGRKLRVTLAEEAPRHKLSSKSRGGSASLLSASYWARDISTKCFRCGQVGHIEASCPNEAKPKPCTICAQTGHDFRNCAIKAVCFRCGVPGHVIRDCSYQQNLPKRIVCGICFQSGHHRSTCRRRATDAPTQHAKCMVCGRKGHFMCKEMKWFFGLEGLSCFNCGRPGHHGYDCRRPTVDQCNQDESVAQREIDRATADSLADQLQQQRNRGRQQQRGPSDRHRAKSQDPRVYRPSADNSRGYATSQGQSGGGGPDYPSSKRQPWYR